MVAAVAADRIEVSVRNLGGIEALDVDLAPGVTVLVGHNATNRTSLLRSIGAGLGGSTGRLRRSAAEGDVTLDLGDESYTRTLRRVGDDVRVEGEPYTDRSELVDTFACLLESNPVRRAVQRGDGDRLRDLLLEPVDVAAIEERVAEKQSELDDVQARIDEAERKLGNLPALEARRSELADELAAVTDELEELEATLAEHEADLEDAELAESVLEDLQAARSEYERVRDDRRTQAEALDSLAEELASVEEDLAALEVDEERLAAVEEDVEGLQRRERELASTVESLRSIVSFNEDLLDGDGVPGTADGDPVAALDPQSRSVECWTCGTTVERGAIEGRLDELRAVVEEKRTEREAVADELEAVRQRRATLRSELEQRDSLLERRAELEAEVEDREDRLADLEAREAELRERVDSLEAESADSEAAREADLAERYRRRSELAYERGQLEQELDGVETQIAETEALETELAELEDRRAELRSELRSLRDRVDEVERSAVETFNEHVATVLEVLEYANVERVWIERTGESEAASFDLHVVRAGDDGAVYEDVVDHLSESEREVVGLVVALAGYLVHDVHEAVPVMVLDSLEAIDADRIADLVDYFAEYAPYLAVALLPEDAQALPDAYDRVRMAER